MHSKRKGNIGQIGVALKLASLEFSVFTEQGDISKIDLIAEKGGKIITIQCKAIKPVKGCIHLPLTKSGPNYRFKYEEAMFDFFAIYNLDSGEVYLVPSSILRTNTNALSLRTTPTVNNQDKGVHYAKDYLIEGILRDFTSNSLPGKAEGDDKVQTATT